MTGTGCAEQGGFCDASNACIRFAPREGVLVERLLGTCEFGDLGGPFGGGEPPEPRGPAVEFINNTRNGDLVVVAKDTTRGLPGGTKQLTVRVTPSTKTADLTIETDRGTTGSAFFCANCTQTQLQVHDGDVITLYGGEVSSKPRNMAITAKIDGKPPRGTRFVFTVFRVDPEPLVSGQLAQVLPAHACWRIPAASWPRAASHSGRG